MHCLIDDSEDRKIHFRYHESFIFCIPFSSITAQLDMHKNLIENTAEIKHQKKKEET